MPVILGEGFVEEVRCLLHSEVYDDEPTLAERVQVIADHLHDHGHAATIRSDPTGGSGAVFSALEILWHDQRGPHDRDIIRDDIGWSP